MKRVLIRSLIAVSVAMLLFVNNAFAAEKTFPWKNMDFIIATPPGGAADALVRMIKNIMLKHKLVEVPITVVNKPGGAGLVGLQDLEKMRGDGHGLYIVTNLIFLNELYGRSDKHYSESMTPLATLTTEWCSLSARSDSKYKTGLELMTALQKDPKAVSFGVPMQGSDHHLSLLLIAKKFGIDPKALKVVAYPGSGQMIPALLGGHVDVISLTPSTMIEHKRAGKTRYLAIASNERLQGELADVPTWKEMGCDAVFPHWRGVAGPPDMPADAIAWWDKTLARFVETPEWKELMNHMGWDNYYMNSRDTSELWEKEFIMYQQLVEMAGLGKK